MKTEYTFDDILRGHLWYRQHKVHVDQIVKEERHEYPMSGSDITRPELWKPAAWKWFLRNHNQ